MTSLPSTKRENTQVQPSLDLIDSPLSFSDLRSIISLCCSCFRSKESLPYLPNAVFASSFLNFLRLLSPRDSIHGRLSRALFLSRKLDFRSDTLTRYFIREEGLGFCKTRLPSYTGRAYLGLLSLVLPRDELRSCNPYILYLNDRRRKLSELG